MVRVEKEGLAAIVYELMEPHRTIMQLRCGLYQGYGFDGTSVPREAIGKMYHCDVAHIEAFEEEALAILSEHGYPLH